MEKINRFSNNIEGSICSDFIFTSFEPTEVNGPSFFRKTRDITILLNDRLTSQFDPIRLKQAITPRQNNDAAYQSLSDAQKFDAIKPRVIQQPADLEMYNEILQNNAEKIKDDYRETEERSRILREIAHDSQEIVSRGTTSENSVTD